ADVRVPRSRDGDEDRVLATAGGPRAQCGLRDRARDAGRIPPRLAPPPPRGDGGRVQARAPTLRECADRVLRGASLRPPPDEGRGRLVDQFDERSALRTLRAA